MIVQLKPKPQTNERLVARYQSGDRAALALLYQQNLNFLWKMAIRYASPQDREDAVQEGALVLLRCADVFDPARGHKFITLLWPAVCNRLTQWRAKQTLVRVPYSALKAGVGPFRWVREDDEGAWILPNVTDYRAHESDLDRQEREWLEGQAMLETILRRMLGSRELVIVRRRLQGATLREIGAELGVTKERVRQIQNRALGRLGVDAGALK